MAKRNGGIIGPDNVPSGMFGSAGGVWRLEDAFNYQKAGTWPVALGYQIPNSLRFNSGSDDSLTRTFGSSGNRKTWTFSTWIKRSNLINANMNILGTDYASNGEAYFVFRPGEKLLYGQYEGGGTSNNFSFETTQVFRDVSAWYNILLVWDTTQSTSSDRMKIYINGTQVTSFSSATYPTQNLDGVWNSNRVHYIGDAFYGTNLDGYLSETYFIDGQALTPSSFGETDATTEIWIPKTYTGTYGTNGFYLKFANSSSLGTDSSGNANTWTVNNLTSVDQSTDTPTNNFPTFNGLCAGSGLSLTEGNLKAAYSGSDAYKTIASTFGVTKGKWYWEHKIGSDTTYQLFGITTENNIFDARNTDVMTNFKTSYCWLAYATEARSNTTGGAYSSITYGTSLTGGDIVGCALDLDNNKIWWSKNGTWQNSGDPVAGTGQAFTIASSSSLGFAYFPMVIVLETASGIEISFGNASFTIASGNADANGFGNFEYAVPSGYYALCSKNLALYG